MPHPLGYAVSRLLLKWIFAPFTRVYVLNREATAGREPLIYAANHISHFDPPLLGVAAHGKIDFMAMVELFEQPLLGAWCRAVDAFPVDRAKVDRAAVRIALARLKAGERVGMFPEGGIRDGAESVLGGAKVRPGIGAIAQLSGGPVLPTIILGSDRLYSPSAWLPLRRTPIWIAFGERIPPPGVGKQEREEFEQRLAEKMRTLAAELRAHFKLTDADLPQPASRRKGRG
jgi:1-acyl-sn-glycerol-3-phosphate acyltransferase